MHFKSHFPNTGGVFSDTATDLRGLSGSSESQTSSLPALLRSLSVSICRLSSKSRSLPTTSLRRTTTSWATPHPASSSLLPGVLGPEGGVRSEGLRFHAPRLACTRTRPGTDAHHRAPQFTLKCQYGFPCGFSQEDRLDISQTGLLPPSLSLPVPY